MTARILLVEDDLLERRRLESSLSHLGYTCTSVGDGDAAVARLAVEAFDCVLLDLVLPGLDGLGVLGALRARGCPVPVVACVTPGGLDAVASAIRLGARDFVVKPVGALRLNVAITNAIALANLVREEAQARADRHNVVTLTPVPDVEDLAEEPSPQVALIDPHGHVRALVQIEEEAIRAAVTLYGGRMSEVARRLGIGRSTLYRRLNALGLAVTEPYRPLAVAAE
ncbi:response regulator [Roseixanthobacter pseudopolyaromaticivorans]|uniref:response regulator n=1 Tax=Xanthobacteraceae TaxID=335928 RepID=UPI003728FE12